MHRAFSHLADGLIVRSLRLRGIRRRLLDHPDGRVHALAVTGRGPLPPVLVLHGLGSCAADEARLIKALVPACRAVYAVDLPGHGHSTPPPDGRIAAGADALAGALGQLTDEPVVVIGNSLGCLAAIRVAQARPDLVAGLFLLAPGGAPMTQDELEAATAIFRHASHADVLHFLDRMFFTTPGVRHAAAWVIRGRALRPGLRVAVQQASTDDLLVPTDLAGLPMPVEVLWGEHERLLPAHGRDFFEAHLPAGSVRTAHGLGHTPQHQDLRFVVAEARRFLERVAAR
ncbi:MAG: alpha/beta fold hydrolase [Myxococcales bacterium]|nr:alpha/beta fold hydrolase [Myxococcales bacterium]